MSQPHRINYLITSIAKYSDHTVSSSSSSSSLLPVIDIIVIIREPGYLSRYSDRLLDG
jgi:hypothetical protein